MRLPRPVTVDIDDADPTDAINAFLHNINRQRALGLCPRTEHELAEHLFRGDARIVFYSNSGGIISLIEGGEIDYEDAEEMLMLILGKRKARAARLREEREAAAAELEALPETPESEAPSDHP